MLLGDADVCEICFEEEIDDDDLLVFCDGCGVCVHALCYGITEELREDEQWFCESCAFLVARNPDLPLVGEFPLRNNTFAPKCCLCHNSLPLATQQIAKTELFAHVLCFRFAPLLSFEFFQRLSAGSTAEEAVNKVEANMSQCCCDICGLDGNVRDCCVERCRHAFHPSCCVFAKGQLFIKETETTEFLQLLCAEHAGSMTIQTDIWGGFERILNNNFDFPVDFEECNIGLQIATLRTCESDETFAQTLQVFGGNAVRSYDREISLEQEAMLEAEQIWQYTERRAVESPAEVGCALMVSEATQQQILAFHIDGSLVEVSTVARLYSFGKSCESSRVDFMLVRAVSAPQVEELIIEGLVPVFICHKTESLAIRDIVFKSHSDIIGQDRYYLFSSAALILPHMEAFDAVFAVQLPSYTMDHKLYTYIH